jgi:23S rRNA (uridine2552-2'-O)-methyltransferase
VAINSMAKNKFNQSWLHDHINDPYVKLAQR